MATQQLPLFYKKIVPLNKEQHKGLFIEPVEGYEFAATTNSLYIAVVEFPRAVAEYPIVFGKDKEGHVFPVVLLGLKNNENLYVDKKGKWNANYIPAYARRYPFILATPEQGGEADKFTVCIDEAFPGFNTAKEGRALFKAGGEHTQALQQAIDFLKEFQNHVAVTRAFCNNLVELDLLETMQANVSLKSGEKLSVGGFHCVKREKLKALQPKKLAELVKSDQLELIYLHLQSLNNIGTLMGKAS